MASVAIKPIVCSAAFDSSAPGRVPVRPALLRVATAKPQPASQSDAYAKTAASPTQNPRFPKLITKAAGESRPIPPPKTKVNSIVCAACDGNGAKQCTQCNGAGVNAVDHFNGRFKAGGLCWLCRGKREILCGDCNGAGFIGGFMSTFED